MNWIVDSQRLVLGDLEAISEIDTTGLNRFRGGRINYDPFPDRDMVPDQIDEPLRHLDELFVRLFQF